MPRFFENFLGLSTCGTAIISKGKYRSAEDSASEEEYVDGYEIGIELLTSFEELKVEIFELDGGDNSN